MYLNFRIRLLELEGVSSKQTYLDVVEQVITENNNYKQVACKNGGGVIMKVIVMKLEMTCVPIILILIASTNVRTLSLIKVPIKLAASLSTGLHHSRLIAGSHCRVVMKVIVMKELSCFENTLLNNYIKDKCEDIITSKVSRKLVKFN